MEPTAAEISRLDTNRRVEKNNLKEEQVHSNNNNAKNYVVDEDDGCEDQSGIHGKDKEKWHKLKNRSRQEESARDFKIEINQQNFYFHWECFSLRLALCILINSTY